MNKPHRTPGAITVVLVRCDTLADAIHWQLLWPSALNLRAVGFQADRLASSVQRTLGVRDRHYDHTTEGNDHA